MSDEALNAHLDWLDKCAKEQINECVKHEFMCATNEYLKCKYCPKTMHPDEAEAILNAHASLIEKVERLEKRNHQHTYCAYCGKEFPIDVDHAIDAVQSHIFECEKHPMYRLIHGIGEKCLDLDAEAQELLAEGDDYRDLGHASGIHKSIDAIRDVVCALLESER